MSTVESIARPRRNGERRRAPTASISKESPAITGVVEMVDRKSGSAGMPRPISYAVFCLKKKKKRGDGAGDEHGHAAVRRQGRNRQRRGAKPQATDPRRRA